MSGALLNAPIDTAGFVYTIANTTGNNVAFSMQFYWTYSTKRLFYRIENNGTWGSWSEIVPDIPSFYKDYANKGALANGLSNGGSTGSLGQVIVSGQLESGYPTVLGTVIKFKGYYTSYLCISHNGAEMWVTSDSATGTSPDQLTWHRITVQ